jgi:hypothetical protein
LWAGFGGQIEGKNAYQGRIGCSARFSFEQDGGRVDSAMDYSLLVDLVHGGSQAYSEREKIPDAAGK